MSHNGISVMRGLSGCAKIVICLERINTPTEAAEFAESRSKVKVVEIDAGKGAQLSHPELIAESILWVKSV